MPEVLLLVVCGTIADCDDYEGIADGARRICVSASLVALSSWGSGALADRADEPHRPGAVLGRLHGLGAETWPDAATSLPSTADPAQP
jgi:hypothetical protein